MGAYTFDPVAANNTNLDGVGSQGSNRANLIDNLARTLGSALANFVRDLGAANTSVGGTADIITVALADISVPTAYFDGMIFSFRPAADSTSTAPTLNVDSLGAKVIKRSIQGVESALIAGDLQAGQTAMVVYRSAWASAAGAFELLNPSIVSSIELGHATDTTLSRSAAGVVAVEGGAGSMYVAGVELGHASDTTLSRGAAGFIAVEGKRVPSPASQATADILYRGATEWERLAIGATNTVLKADPAGPYWGKISTYVTPQATTSGTAFDFTGIPSWVYEIDVVLDRVSLSGTDSILVQLGDSGGIETSGYVSSQSLHVSASNSVGFESSGFLIRGDGATRQITGILHIKYISGFRYVASGVFGGYSDAVVLVAGSKATSATLDRLRVTRSGTNTFDAGEVTIYYR